MNAASRDALNLIYVETCAESVCCSAADEQRRAVADKWSSMALRWRRLVMADWMEEMAVMAAAA